MGPATSNTFTYRRRVLITRDSRKVSDSLIMQSDLYQSNFWMVQVPNSEPTRLEHKEGSSQDIGGMVLLTSRHKEDNAGVGGTLFRSHGLLTSSRKQ